MGKKASVFGIAGVFIMFSFLPIVIGTELFNIFNLPQVLLVLLSAGIGFYLLGYGLEME